MPDWGILQALSGRRNWDGIRAEKQNELRYQEAMNQMQAVENAKQQENAAKLQQYLNSAQQLRVLPKGLERIQEIDNTARTPIKEGIIKYGGDLNKFMSVEGMPALQNYLNNILHHPTTVKELSNAANVAKWQADQEEGLQERLDMDPKTGEFAPDFGAKLQQYNSGDIDALNYAGAFKPAKFDEKFFSTQYGDANRYKSVPVSYETYKNTAMRNLMDAGLNERDAKQQATVQANNYKQQMLEKGTPLRFKSDKWTPTKAWEDGNAAKISSKYIVDAFDALLDPKNNQIWAPAPNEMIQQVSKQLNLPAGFLPESIKMANVLPDFSLGKKTITYNRQKAKYDKDGKPAGQEVEAITEPVEDAIEPFIKTPDGKVYMQTTANRLEGKPPFLLTDGAIDKTFAGVSKTKSVLNVIASLREALKANQNLTKAGRPDFTDTPQYVDANGNDVDFDGATQADIDAAISAGLIKPKE